MGKTHQPLTIVVSRKWLESPWAKALEAKGHKVVAWLHEEPDLILHEAAHMWDDDMEKYLEPALKAARKRRYPPKEKKK